MNASLVTALAADVPVLLWGAPGTGKTAAIEQLARDQRAELVTVIGSCLDPVDISGLPSVSGWRLVPWAERLVSLVQSGQQVWLFLDELSCAPPSVQAALLRVVLAREIGGQSIRGCRVLAAANPPETAADGGWLSAATANRWAHVQWTVDAAHWVAGELAGWGKPVSEARAHAGASICGYVRKTGIGALLAVPADAEQSGRAWPSPRSWSNAVALLAHSDGPRGSHALQLVESCIGPEAHAWHTWELAQDLPDPEQLLSGTASVPKRGDQAHVAVLALAAHVLCANPNRDQRIRRAWAILASLRPDIALAGARALRLGAPEITSPESVALGSAILACHDCQSG